MNARGRGRRGRHNNSTFRNGNLGNNLSPGMSPHRMGNPEGYSTDTSFGRPPFSFGYAYPPVNQFQAPYVGGGSSPPNGGGLPYVGTPPYGGGPAGGNGYGFGRGFSGGSSGASFGPTLVDPFDLNARPWYPGDPRHDAERFPPPPLAAQPLNEVSFNSSFKPVPPTAVIVLHGVSDFKRVLEQAMKLLISLKRQHEDRIAKLNDCCSPDTLSLIWHDALRADLDPESRHSITKWSFGDDNRGILMLQGACEKLRHRLIDVTWTPNRVSDHFVQGSQRIATQVYGEVWTKGANIITSILLAAQHSHHLDQALAEAEGLKDYLNRTRNAWVAQDEMRRSWLKEGRDLEEKAHNDKVAEEQKRTQDHAKPNNPQGSPKWSESDHPEGGSQNDPPQEQSEF